MKSFRHSLRPAAGIFLLAVWMFALCVRTFHTHQETVFHEDSCYECSHHLKHPAHFTSGAHATDNCVICHILTVPFLCQQSISASGTESVSRFFDDRLSPLTERTVILQNTRAPPSSFMA